MSRQIDLDLIKYNSIDLAMDSKHNTALFEVNYDSALEIYFWY